MLSLLLLQNGGKKAGITPNHSFKTFFALLLLSNGASKCFSLLRSNFPQLFLDAYIYPTDSVEIQRLSSASASFFVMMRRSFDDAEEDLQRFLGSPVIDAKSMRKNSRKCILK